MVFLGVPISLVATSSGFIAIPFLQKSTSLFFGDKFPYYSTTNNLCRERGSMYIFAG